MSQQNGYGKWVDWNALIGAIQPNSSQICNILGQFPSGVLQNTDSIIAYNNSGCKKIPSNYIINPGALCNAAQGTLRGTYTIGDDLFFMRPDGTCYKDSIRWSQYSGDKWNCDSTENCLNGGVLCDALKAFGIASYDDGANVFVEMPDGSCKKINLQDIVGQGGTFNCDSVAYCLLQEGVLCDALNAYGTTNGIPDYIIGVENGNCFRVDGNLFGGGGVNCGQIDSCLANSDTLCDLIKDCLIGDDFFCQMVDSCLQNSDSLCAYVEDCLETFNWDSIVCVGLNGIPESTYEDGDSAIIVRDGSCYKIAWHCCDSSNGQNLIAGDCIDITGDTISVKVDPSNDNLLECTSNGLFVDKNLCGTYDINELTNGDYWIINRGNDCYRVPVELVGDNCVSLQLDAGAIKTGVIISPDLGNSIECRANGLYSKTTCDYTDGGNLANGDKIVVKTGTDCVVKTYTSPFDCGASGGTGFTGCIEVMTRIGGVCQFRTYQMTQCPPPDAPLRDAIIQENTSLKKQVAVLEKQNREFEKRLKLIESKLK